MIPDLKATIQTCISRIRLLFVFKQKLLGSKKPLVSRKLHMLYHALTWIQSFGSLLSQDTERWEAYLPDCAKNVSRVSQRRRTATAELLMNKVGIILFVYCYHIVTR